MSKRRVVYSTQFKKDLKKYRNQPTKRAKIVHVVDLLAKGEPLPPALRAHKLIGNYAQHMELHIEGDLLLIWIEKTNEGEEEVHLMRLGSHAELFKK